MESVMSNKFEIGKTYQTRSACDHDCIFSIEVTARTEKTVTVKIHNRVKRCKITLRDGVETCAALGTYSMSPTFRAGV